MKKLLIAALAVCLAFGLFACAGNGNGYGNDYDTRNAPTQPLPGFLMSTFYACLGG